MLGLVLFCIGCTTTQGFNANCEESANVACAIMKRHGFFTRIEIQKTPWSDKGIYHAQCQVLVGGEWKYVVLDKYPTATMGWREYGEGIEYR